MSEPLQFSRCLLIGDNDHGYQFYVGLCGERWVGYALSRDERGRPTMLFVMAEVSDGPLLGLTDRDDAIRMTGAVARDVESSYGPLARWYADPELLVDPELYRCEQCGQIGCDGSECHCELFDSTEPSYEMET